MVSALAFTDIPVARPVTMCQDDSVLGAPFTLVEYVVGQVIRTQTELETIGSDCAVRDCVDDLIDVLAALHHVDPVSVGLGDWARADGYLQRQYGGGGRSGSCFVNPTIRATRTFGAYMRAARNRFRRRARRRSCTATIASTTPSWIRRHRIGFGPWWIGRCPRSGIPWPTWH